jgi:hypothetical protein
MTIAVVWKNFLSLDSTSQPPGIWFVCSRIISKRSCNFAPNLAPNYQNYPIAYWEFRSLSIHVRSENDSLPALPAFPPRLEGSSASGDNRTLCLSILWRHTSLILYYLPYLVLVSFSPSVFKPHAVGGGPHPY